MEQRRNQGATVGATFKAVKRNRERQSANLAASLGDCALPELSRY